MCEFDVILNGKVVSKDVVYARYEGGKVVVRNVLGEASEYVNCKIEEIDVNTTRLVLSAVESIKKRSESSHWEITTCRVFPVSSHSMAVLG